MSKRIDIHGQRFGRLTVLSFLPGEGLTKSGKKVRGKWVCKCDCGNLHLETTNNLVSGRTVSCGCKKKAQAEVLNHTHGEAGTRLYRIWSNMLSRTSNPRVPCYKNYGGRGISVCPEWRDHFEAFRDWALSAGYTDELSIDRIDNDSGYSPSNCRWVSMNVQFNNRGNNRRLTHGGVTKTVAQWARSLSISKHTLYSRLNARWSIERALTEPVEVRHV